MAAEAGPVWALGLMSGTSMDGLDAAALLTDGVAIRGFGPSLFLPFAAELRAQIRAALGVWPGQADLGALEAALRGVAAEAVLRFPSCRLVGTHGQTLAHDPGAARTHQLGDGTALARATGRTVVWDFRTADVASGGEGAPLVPVYHHALARMLGLDAPAAFLNLGGVGNVTWVEPRTADPARALLAFDTGPGNALIDDLVHARGAGARAEGGALALRGRPDEAVVAEVLADPYFARPAPKSLDRNHFAWAAERVAGLALEDAAATLAMVTAATVAAAVRHMPEPPARWLVAGGGRHNAAIMRMLAAHSNAPVEPVEAAGLDGDFIEAQAFAYLAVRIARGLPTSFPATTGARLPVAGGRVSAPR